MTRCSRRTNMIPLDYRRYEDEDRAYQMVTDMIGNEEDLGEVESNGWRLALMRWAPRDLDKKGYKDRYLIVHHDPQWNDWDAWTDVPFKMACKMVKQYREDAKEYERYGEGK